MAIGFNSGTKNAVNGTTTSISHTASGSERYVLIGLYQNTDDWIVNAISYGGQTPTLLGSLGRLRAYGLLAPNTGSQTVSVTSNSSDGLILAVTSWTGVDQSTPTGTIVTNSNTEIASISGIGASATGNIVVDMAVMINLEMAAAVGQTERISYDEPSPDGHQSGFFAFGMSSKPGAASVSMQWDCSESFGDNRIIVVPLIAASGGGGPSLSNQKGLLLGIG